MSGANQLRTGPGSQKRKPGVHVGEESNRGIVPAKPLNKTAKDSRGGSGGGKVSDQGEQHGI